MNFGGDTNIQYIAGLLSIQIVFSMKSFLPSATFSHLVKTFWALNTIFMVTAPRVDLSPKLFPALQIPSPIVPSTSASMCLLVISDFTRSKLTPGLTQANILSRGSLYRLLTSSPAVIYFQHSFLSDSIKT